ncbi:MAG: hypothetical protein RR193_05480 [Christensenellaceae bacterium]
MPALLQIAPHPEYGYRTQVASYEVLEDMDVAIGKFLKAVSLPILLKRMIHTTAKSMALCVKKNPSLLKNSLSEYQI